MKEHRNERTSLVAYTNKDKNNAPEKIKNYPEQEKQNLYTDETSEPTKHDDSLNVTTFEDILNFVGTRGRWNVMLLLLYICTSCVTAMQTLSYQFLGATPDHWCHVEPLIQAGWTQEQILDFAIPVDENGKHEKCFMYDYNYSLAAEVGYKVSTASRQNNSGLVPCYSRDFNRSQYQSTVTTEWDLVCERRALYSTTQAAVEIGKLIGFFLTGYLSDIFGRRTLVMFNAAVLIPASFGCALSFSVGFYIFLKVVTLIAAAGTILGTYVLMMETNATWEREKTSTMTAISWSVGYMLIPVVAYYIRAWKGLQVAISLPTLAMIPFYWFFPESPRWLITQGRFEDALKELKEGARVNGRTLPSDSSLLAAMQRLHAKTSGEHEPEAAAASGCGCTSQWLIRILREYFTLLMVKEVRQRTLIVFCCWFVSGLVYYGISLNATNISVSVYLYMFLGGLGEIVSLFLMWLLITHVRRVKSLLLLWLICAFTMLTAAFVMACYPKTPTSFIMFLSLTGKMAITAVFAIMWLITQELFPTKYRSLATSQANVASRIGSIFSPYINDLLGDAAVWAPSVIYCATTFLAASLSSLLPETKGRCLPENFSLMPDTKDNENMGYLPNTETGFVKVPIKSRNSNVQPQATSDTAEVTDTKQ
ncbi:solute carrier family 22 member 7-like [Scylla paramamosain]|uniref:solute carrier family 22 member 7-like n=1 Tax=Scylla paramamosain TaxID=85552 RepID=UPI003083AE20